MAIASVTYFVRIEDRDKVQTVMYNTQSSVCSFVAEPGKLFFLSCRSKNSQTCRNMAVDFHI